MKNSLIKILLGLLILVGVAITAWWAGVKFNALETKREQNVSVVLDKVEKVFKFVAVEGHVSEIFNHKEYYGYDLPIFRKKALIRVNAKVSVGYDFDKVNITTNRDAGTVTISNFPPAEILSVDHDLDYYDMTEGTFNQFSSADLTKLNQEAKAYATNKALQGQLITEAETQKEELMDMIRGILLSMGYELILINDAPDVIKG